MMTLRVSWPSNLCNASRSRDCDSVRDVGGIEGSGDLGVQVDAVDDDDHRRVPELRMQAQLLRREDHQQRFARALKVPDQALSDVSVDNTLDDLVGGLVLLVASR